MGLCSEKLEYTKTWVDDIYLSLANKNISVEDLPLEYIGDEIRKLYTEGDISKFTVPQANESQYYTIQQPNPTISNGWLKSLVYQTKDMKITLTGSIYGDEQGAHLCSLFNTNTTHRIHTYGGATLTFVFSKTIKPWRIRYSGQHKMTVQVYNGTSWTTKKSNVSSGTHNISSTGISQIKITFSGSGQLYLYYCILDFLSDNYVYNPTIYNK